jgi:hypothetical protein
MLRLFEDHQAIKAIPARLLLVKWCQPNKNQDHLKMENL